jgi:hypothetical protein
MAPRKVIFENNRFNVSDDLSMDEIQETFGDAIPGLETAEGHEDSDGNYVFTKKAGTKGC